ncbi:MAG TPA: outer membrane protein assembly factor BamA [Spongiibacteraceae bacterium]|nr:outer membrane protein assembly factor BamA [Spongiibacteraceae bacterium]HCS26485.1 outer membrane protein assembly factor BamA [Spongiibacteraceae bacterium]
MGSGQGLLVFSKIAYRFILLALTGPMFAALAFAADRTIISDIRVEGLQRISADTVFAALPLNVGDAVSEDLLASAARSLFRTGNFDDIKIARDGDVLVIIVAERPSISEINIDGNKAIKTEALLDGLKNSGLSEGQVFKRSTLEGMRMELTRQYVSQGRYDASIETDVIAQPRNRVAVSIHVDEGSTASIKHINIVGNEAFTDKELLSEFELKPSGWFSWISSSDKYAREKLKGDLEKLSSFYLDRGYIKFNIDSTQVAISPDKESVYITANISEGEVYNIGKVELSGDVVLPEEDLSRFLLPKTEEIFSQSRVTSTEELLTKRLGNEGYNFARVSGIPEIDDEKRVVDLKFFIDPGKRTYVRRIDFSGNHRTSDEVLRREMRQMESAPASQSSIEMSRVRLERLGFFKEAKADTTEVPGTDDMIDLRYVVEEQSSGSLAASVGFSQDSGLILGANIQQNNFFGTGKQVGVGLSRSDFLTNISFNYLEPYFTEDGVSRGFSVYYRKANLDEVNIASYTTNTAGAALNFSYPLSEIQRLGFSLGFANTEIDAGIGAVQEILASPRLFDFIGEFYTSRFNPATGTYSAAEVLQPISALPAGSTPTGEPGFLDLYGDEFNNFTISTNWRRSTLNRGLLATRGNSQTVSLEVALPGSDTEYYKLIFDGQVYVPLINDFVLRFKTQLGYGDGYGDLDELPFFENFYAGGFGSIRGYKSNTLGPRSTPAQIYRLSQAATAINAAGNATALAPTVAYVLDPVTNQLVASPFEFETDPFGGNVLIETSIELLVPLPFVKDQRSVRSGFFFDAGNVFSTSCRSTQLNCTDVSLSDLRYSAGFGLTWITGFGPLTFSLARALNDEAIDDTEVFQFSLGRTF